MKSTQARYITRLLILLLVTLIVAVPTAYLAAPHVRRWQHIRWLTSDDLLKRQQGLLYVSAHAETDEGVLMGAVGRLDVVDSTNFLQIVWALQSASRWRRAYIPDDAWLRWNVLMATDPDVEVGSLVAQRLADLHDLADDARVIGLLEVLLKNDEPDVRYNALCAAAVLYPSAKQPEPYHTLFRQSVEDTDAVIAHHAAIFAYLTGAPDSKKPVWLDELPDAPEDRAYDEQEIRRLLESPHAPLRDVGCVLAARDLPTEVQDTLIEACLEGDTGQIITGALLAGVTRRQNALLRDKLKEQTEWPAATSIKLGMWMQGKGPYGELIPSVYLARDDVPRSSVIMAMLSKPDANAYEALFNPSGEAPDDLVPLLQDYGWWRVLNHYLLDGAPRWVPTDEPILQQYQADLLRDWYLMHRRDVLAKQLRLTY